MKVGKHDEGRAMITDLVAEIKASESAKVDKRIQALLADLQGQVTEAFSRSEYYTKWGVHYLPSLINAHLLQMCNNFKDPGVQVYGGELFTKFRDRADEIFVKLPPPKPSYDNRAAPVAMNVYHSRSNPCFDGECIVQTINGATKLKDLKRGDRVRTPSDHYVEIVCVVKTSCHEQRAQLVELPGGLLVTPYHPVRIDGQWQFPCQLAKVHERPCPAVYSFVLKEEHVMLINGIACVSLGHDFQDEVVRHPYFGSPRVIDDLQKMNGWASGHIHFLPNCLLRDEETALVCGFRQN